MMFAEHRLVAEQQAEARADEPETRARERADQRRERERARTSRVGTSMPTIDPPTTSENAATKKPLTTTGTARPRNSGSRGAGLTRMYPSVCWKRSPAIAKVIANRQGIAAYCTALPMTKNSSDSMPAERPMYDEQQDLEDGRNEHRGDVDLRTEEPEQGPEAEKPADEEEAHGSGQGEGARSAGAAEHRLEDRDPDREVAGAEAEAERDLRPRLTARGRFPNRVDAPRRRERPRERRGPR